MRHKEQNGQIMILSVLLISSAVLGAAALASMLVLFQLRGANNASESAEAVFAADAGIEHALYERFNPEEGLDCPRDIELGPVILDTTGSSYVVRGDCTSASSLGKSSSDRSARSFSISFEGLCAIGGQSNNCP